MIAKIRQTATIYLMDILNRYENTRFMPMVGKDTFKSTTAARKPMTTC